MNFSDWSTGGNWGSSMFYGTDWKKFNTPSNDLLKAYDDEKDVVRKGATIFTADVTGNSLNYNVLENRLIWPIPQGEIDKNASLRQNTGY